MGLTNTKLVALLCFCVCFIFYYNHAWQVPSFIVLIHWEFEGVMQRTKSSFSIVALVRSRFFECYNACRPHAYFRAGVDQQNQLFEEYNAHCCLTCPHHQVTSVLEKFMLSGNEEPRSLYVESYFFYTSYYCKAPEEKILLGTLCFSQSSWPCSFQQLHLSFFTGRTHRNFLNPHQCSGYRLLSTGGCADTNASMNSVKCVSSILCTSKKVAPRVQLILLNYKIVKRVIATVFSWKARWAGCSKPVVIVVPTFVEMRSSK